MLRTYIRELIKEALLTGEKIITLSRIDVDNVLVENKLKFNDMKDLNVYCAYTHVGKWYKEHLNDETMKIVIEDAGASPFQVADVIKKDITVVKKDKKTRRVIDTYKLIMAENDREYWWRRIAQKISNRFKNDKIQAVTCADSTSPMPQQIAENVARILGVPFIKVFEKNKSVEKITLNIKRFNKWYETPVQVKDEKGKPVFDKMGKPVLRNRTDDERYNYLEQLINNLVTLRNGLRQGLPVSIARNIRPSRREFFNGIHNILDDKISNINGNLLIIDDNIDSGATFVDIDKQLEQYKNIKPVYAAGFRMNRSSSGESSDQGDAQNTEYLQDTTKQVMPDSPKPSEKKAVIPYSFKEPQNYKVDDLIKSDKFGVGKIINVNPIDKKIIVKFSDRTRILAYIPDSNINKEEEKIDEIIRRILLKLI
jgi:phosphoribosylpyrophosphate synthetase